MHNSFLNQCDLLYNMLSVFVIFYMYISTLSIKEAISIINVFLCDRCVFRNDSILFSMFTKSELNRPKNACVLWTISAVSAVEIFGCRSS